MKCKNCGREIKKGEIECECGAPIEQEKAVDKNAKLTTPDGRDLSALEKPAVKKTDISPVILVVIAAVIAIIAFIIYKVIVGSDIRNKDNWKTVEKDTFSITIPKAMEESDDNVEVDSDYEKVGFFKCDKASVYISKAEFNEDEKKVVRNEGVQTLKRELINNGKKGNVMGYNLTPQERGDFIFVAYPVVAKGLVEGTDKVWAVSATLLTKECIYQIDAYCSNDDAEDYEGAMNKWLESFKLK